MGILRVVEQLLITVTLLFLAAFPGVKMVPMNDCGKNFQDFWPNSIRV